MAYIKYYFKRDKNLYEKAWDYNSKLTKAVSFITDWFWITDVTELSQNTRECEKGFNMLYILLSMLVVVCLYLRDTIWLEYALYLKIVAISLLVVMSLYPLVKLMAKLSCLFILYYFVFMQFIYPQFTVGLAGYLSAVVCLSLPGLYFNYSYLQKVKAYKGFELEKVEVSQFSLYYLYYKLVKGQDIESIERKIKDEL